MRTVIATILLVLLALPVFAQLEVSVPPVPSLEAYRPVGEARLWSFEIERQNIGRLISTVSKKTEINDQPAYVINEVLSLDFSKAGSGLNIQIAGDQFVSANGYYLGSEQDQTINEQHSHLKAERHEAIIEATTTSGDNATAEKIILEPKGFVYDLFFLDQIELYFAMHGLKVGETYTDTLFSPQPMMTTVFNGLVIDFAWTGLYTGHYDSVFIINVSLPEPARLMITKDHRLVKADFINRKLKVYLDAIRQTSGTAGGGRPPVTLARLVMLVPIVGIYLTIAGLILMLLGWDGFKSEEAYIALLIGAAAYVVVPTAQFSIQNWMVHKLVAPNLQSKAIWYAAIAPAFVAGLIQTVLIGGGLLILRRFPRVRDLHPSVIGAFVGAGFGVAEASFLAFTTAGQMLYTWGLLDKATLIIFHSAVGALIGWGVRGKSRRLLKVLICVVIISTLVRYAPLLVQQRVLEWQLLYIVLAVVVLIFLVPTLALVHNRQPIKAVQHPVKQSTR